MPTIPYKTSQGTLPSANPSSAGLTVPQNTGAGTQAFGQDLGGASVILGTAFAHAQRLRDAEQAKLDALNAHLAVDTQLVGAQQEMADLTTDSLKQIADHYANGGTKPYLSVPGADGGDAQNMDPREGFKALLQQKVADQIARAKSTAGVQGAALIAHQLREDAARAYSAFEDGRLKLGISQADANVKGNLDLHVQTMASDPYEGEARIKNSIQAYKAAGADPKTAEALQQEAIKKGWDGHNQQSAMNDPTAMLELKKVPYGMDPQKVDTYKALAQATINRDHAESDRLDKEAQQAKAEKEAEQVKLNTIQIYNGVDISADLAINSDRYTPANLEKMYALNHGVRQENKREVTAAQTDQSQSAAEILLHKAKKLYWDEGLLASINEDTVHRWVTQEHILLPEHAAPIYTAIQEAKKHFASEDGAAKQGEKAAFGVLDDLFKVPPQTPPDQAFELQRLKANAEQQLMTILKEDKTNPVEKAMALAAKHQARVLAVQDASIDSLDQGLTTIEKAMVGSWGIAARDTLFTDSHEIKPEPRKMLETLHPMLKGIFLQHDASVERWNQLKTMNQQKNTVETSGAKR